MAIQRLVLDTITDDDYELIAIHCSLAPYRLAFLLNKHLNLKLFRKNKDVNFEYDDVVANFPLYQYDDLFQYNTYNLLGNKFKTKTEPNQSAPQGLFATSEDSYVTKYLIPELKNVDYFLKIETESSMFSSKPMLTHMLTVTQIITAYPVDHTELKSKNNLIFE
ncbi:IPExxxVDY family protein [Aquimarina sp. AU474]|uniref:IPExxxVDY family protein n=1 Tax=Aquimarina sp. AU474 TaxID=2108529 RepID=UPI00135AE930|nr:IPExxxVDY family protein [Aquimarina sp. AU474]